jgi:hypothetical protein
VDDWLSVSDPVMPGPRGRRARLVPCLHLGGTGPVALLMLDANRSRIGVLRNARHPVGEVVDEPYEQGIRSFGIGRPGDHRGLLELSAGYHVAFACRCGACPSGTLPGTI